ncbi:MAG: Ion transport 2 domain protein [Gemmatimonadetes bacterium]|nr:Ion transport 2 domain protein [Gemmatimonadota bacterium]
MFTILGIALLGVGAADMFITVFVSQARGGPIARSAGRGIWRAFRALARKPGGRTHDTVLSLAAPLMIVSTLGIWTLLMVGGFALLYLPHVHRFLLTTGHPLAPWVEALSYSVGIASTVGGGNLVPRTAAMKLVSALEGLSGFAMVTVAVSYLLGVYSELMQAHRLGAEISVYLRGGVAATLERIRAAGHDPFARWCESVSCSLLAMQQADMQYPVLQYFRSGDSSRALTVQVGSLLELTRAVPRTPGLEALPAHPSYVAFYGALEDYILHVERHFVPDSFCTAPPGTAPGSLERAHERVRRYKRY